MIQTLLKAIDILQLFDSQHAHYSLDEISKKLNMPKSSIYNIVNTLRFRGFMEKNHHNEFGLGKAIIPLTQAVLVNVELRDRAAPLLRKMADSCNDSVYLAVLDVDHSLYIYAIESSSRLLARSAVGDRVPLHCIAVGKSILAFLEQTKIKKIIQKVGLPRFTDKTITQEKRLMEELEKIKEQGYAIDRGEHEMNCYCIASPIFNARGKVIAACSISGLSEKIIEKDLTLLSSQVIDTAHEISRRMGFVPGMEMALWR